MVAVSLSSLMASYGFLCVDGVLISQDVLEGSDVYFVCLVGQGGPPILRGTGLVVWSIQGQPANSGIETPICRH